VGSDPESDNFFAIKPPKGYAYYAQSNFADPGNWTSNGSVSTSGNIFSSSSEGSWISNIVAPSAGYEVKTILALKNGGGTYIQYLNATSNAEQIALSDPSSAAVGVPLS
jgi:hypothetical protein